MLVKCWWNWHQSRRSKYKIKYFQLFWHAIPPLPLPFVGVTRAVEAFLPICFCLLPFFSLVCLILTISSLLFNVCFWPALIYLSTALTQISAHCCCCYYCSLWNSLCNVSLIMHHSNLQFVLYQCNTYNLTLILF